MTCVVGIVDADGVHLAADTLASDTQGHSVVTRADPKVFVCGEFVMGFCGAYRVGQVLRYAFKPPQLQDGQDHMEFMVVDFVDALRKVFKKKGALKSIDGEETHGVTFMVGFRGCLYAVEDDFDCGLIAEEHYAIGSGGEFAFGSLHTTAKVGNLTTRDRLLCALDAASAYTSTVRGPYTFVSLPREKGM